MHALIDQARAEVENAGALIDEILFLSELESGKEVVSLGHTAALPGPRETSSSGSTTRRRAPASSSRSRATDRRVPLRPRMLRMVGENLAENAIRYAGHGATLHDLDPDAPGEFAVLTAADDGVGVDERDLARLFERFYRADAARTSRGTGLGLAIVKHIVAAAGGESRRTAGPAAACASAARSRLNTTGARGAFGRSLRAAYVWICFSVFSEATSRLRERHEEELRRVLRLLTLGQRPEDHLPQLGSVRRLLRHDHVGVGADRVGERRRLRRVDDVHLVVAGTFVNAAAAAAIRRRLGKRNFPARFRTAANLMWFLIANATST